MPMDLCILLSIKRANDETTRPELSHSRATSARNRNRINGGCHRRDTPAAMVYRRCVMRLAIHHVLYRLADWCEAHGLNPVARLCDLAIARLSR